MARLAFPQPSRSVSPSTPEGDRDVQDMIERADQGLYVAKKTGRNRVFLMAAAEDRDARAA